MNLSASSVLHLRAPPTGLQYKVHPVVVFSILDHYKRRDHENKRVIGCLMGHRTGNEVEITDCFAVPHQETKTTVRPRGEHLNTMLRLHMKVYPAETLVGWYSTGVEIGYTSFLCHKNFGDIVVDCAKQNGVTPAEPVLLLVDVGCTDHRMGVRVCVARHAMFKGKRLAATFIDTPWEFHSSEAEKIGVDALINGNPEDNRLDAPATVSSDAENLDDALHKLLSMIQAVLRHVERLDESQLKKDPQLAKLITEMLETIPKLPPHKFQELLSHHMQDLLMLTYLLSQTRAQVAIADKLHGLVCGRAEKTGK